MRVDKSRIFKETRSRIVVITERYEFIGNMHLVNLDRRESDVLNDDKPFLHLTEVEVRIRTEKRTTRIPFVAVNKRSIICVIPMDPDREKSALEISDSEQ